MSALRAPEDASPPLNMHRSLIYSGTSICTAAMTILLFRGEQKRRMKDARVAAEIAAAVAVAASNASGSGARSGADVGDTGDGAQGETNDTDLGDNASKPRRRIPLGFLSNRRRRQGKEKENQHPRTS